MNTFSRTMPRMVTNLRFILKLLVMACLVLVMQLWCPTQIVTFPSRPLTWLYPMHLCRICTMTLSMSHNTCTMQPINSRNHPPLFSCRIIRGIAYDTNPDTARAREALWTVNQVINLFKLDDPKSIQQCKAITSQFLSIKNGSPKGQHQVSAVGNCHIGKGDSIFSIE